MQSHRPDGTGRGVVERILRCSAVLEATGWSKSTLYLKISEGKFPKPMKLDADGRAVGWLESWVVSHQVARIAERDGTSAREAA
jgi:prophage regulatory protein